MSWLDEGQGPIYVPALKVAEQNWGIPALVLCRIAYQESHFREDIINGTVKSSAGCVGLMQLNPVYYPYAGQDVSRDIQDAATLLKQDFLRFKDWSLAVAAYNWGSGNVHKWVTSGKRPDEMPKETKDYVAQISADVHIDGTLTDPPTVMQA